MYQYISLLHKFTNLNKVIKQIIMNSIKGQNHKKNQILISLNKSY